MNLLGENLSTYAALFGALRNRSITPTLSQKDDELGTWTSQTVNLKEVFRVGFLEMAPGKGKPGAIQYFIARQSDPA
jgi:hypothetical protein